MFPLPFTVRVLASFDLSKPEHFLAIFDHTSAVCFGAKGPDNFLGPSCVLSILFNKVGLIEHSSECYTHTHTLIPHIGRISSENRAQW